MFDKIESLIKAAVPRKIEGVNAILHDKEQKITPLHQHQSILGFHAGEVRAESLASFCEYVAKYKCAEAIVFASEDANRLEAVFDWHSVEDICGGFGRHRAWMNLQFSPNWLAWHAFNGRELSQQKFAEFIEEHLEDVSAPSAAELLEVVTTLSGKKNVDFKNAVRLANGDVGIQWEETTTAKAGESGNLQVPSEIELTVPIYRGCEESTTFKIRALFRYRINDGRLSFEIRMLGIEKIRDLAFSAVFEDLKKLLPADIQLFAGLVEKSPLQVLYPTLP
ncbi:MAG: DUF2303 family protein [Luteolibacter sp.]